MNMIPLTMSILQNPSLKDQHTKEELYYTSPLKIKLHYQYNFTYSPKGSKK
jgi:hypothetical protein